MRIIAILVVLLALTLPCWGQDKANDSGWHWTFGKNTTVAYFKDFVDGGNYGGAVMDAVDYCHSFHFGGGVITNGENGIPFVELNINLVNASEAYFGDKALLTKVAKIITLQEFGVSDPIRLGTWIGYNTEKNEKGYGIFVGVIKRF